MYAPVVPTAGVQTDYQNIRLLGQALNIRTGYNIYLRLSDEAEDSTNKTSTIMSCGIVIFFENYKLMIIISNDFLRI